VLSLRDAFLYTFAMGLVIFLCRALPFMVFRGRGGEGGRGKFSRFVEQTVPRAAMTVLACNAVAGSLGERFSQGDISGGIPVIAASAFTALVHLWKRNPLISIFGGTALYMILSRLAA
jgi:branched-subunit amino acid transport protein AzlD